MAKKRKQKPIKPDEVFTFGAFRAARYGNNIIYESDWTKEEFDEAQKRAITMYPDIVKKIDELVGDIARIVSELPPEKLLLRAWWEMAPRAVEIETEVEIDFDDAIAFRMIDYVQSIIASVKPAEHQKREVTDEDWAELRGKVEKLFGTLNLSYQICRTAKARAENPDYDAEAEEFFVKAQFYWCNVRGARYQVHEIAHLRDLFIPHSAVIQELFGLTAEQFIDELRKIWDSLTFGIQQIFDEIESFRTDTLFAAEAMIAADPSLADVDPPALMQTVVAQNGWEERNERIVGCLIGTDLHDVGKVTSLPQSLINELTWAPGEETDFFAAGDFRGWPLRIWPSFKRPFIGLNGRSFCFDHNGLFDNIYRVIQRLILRLRPIYRETWNRVQQGQSESLPFKYLQEILPGATEYRGVYYRWHSSPGASKKDWCEADGLLIYDDHLFIVEARAGAFTYTSPANDFPAFIASLENLILKPATQGKRFLDYLESDTAVTLFDKNHSEIGELRKSDFREVTICTVSIDPFTEMAAQVQHLRKIGLDVGRHPVWAVSLDDLRVYADVFEDPLRFLHYVDQRMRAFESDVVQVDDELDHLGLYLKHNNYSLYAERLRSHSDARVNFTGYRSEVDKFFSERLHDPAAPNPLKQETPSRILELIAFLSESERPGRAALSGYILDLDGDMRQQLANFIGEEILAQPSSRRARPLSTYGDVALTVFCYRQPQVRRDADAALDHTRTVLMAQSDERRLLLELSFTESGALADVQWQWVELAAIPPQELPRLQYEAELLRKTRVENALSKRRKIGRNDPCPCGSGMKYKKCCLKNRVG